MSDASYSTIHWSKREPVESLLTREWLVTNGLGGYAAGSVGGVSTRRFHGLLIAALPAPLGRVLYFNHLREVLRLGDGTLVDLGGIESDAGLTLGAAETLEEFRLEEGLPRWRYRAGGVVLEKTVVMPHRQNTTCVTYRLLEAPGKVELRLRPGLNIRPHEGRIDVGGEQPYGIGVWGRQYEIHPMGDYPVVRVATIGNRTEFQLDGGQSVSLLYRIERDRGYDYSGVVWQPGELRTCLAAGESVTLTVSTESWDNINALSPQTIWDSERARRAALVQAARPGAREGAARELLFAADQFVISPASRIADAARAHAAGDEANTVIAGYHWFTDWGRDTMISLEGLSLVTGRHAEAGRILRTFAHHVRNGLIPNLFPEGESQGLYHTADATLWFFHAVDRYTKLTGDRATLEALLPTLRDIIDWHLRGTDFGIGVDPADGLLRQGAQGYQLTWMDAKVDNWVVTPRRGKAVEINALFYNALRLLEGWVREAGDEAAATALAAHAERLRASFQNRFWYAQGNYLYDVVDGEQGDDAALRPNQIFAVSLTNPVLNPERWQAVVHIVREQLLTPVGLRSLARQHPDYKPTYDGDLRARDAAYHQGTVWGWLIGPFIDAWLKVHPEAINDAAAMLGGFVPHLREACIGSISEIFDAEAPFTPRGCVAQAWSVAEVVRSFVSLADARAALAASKPAG